MDETRRCFHSLLRSFVVSRQFPLSERRRVHLRHCDERISTSTSSTSRLLLLLLPPPRHHRRAGAVNDATATKTAEAKAMLHEKQQRKIHSSALRIVTRD